LPARSGAALSKTYIELYISYITQTMKSPVVVHVKSNDNQIYKTNAGIPFECVEFVRRYYIQTHRLTFPSVVDATDMFYRINELTPFPPKRKPVCLKTFIYPYTHSALYYLRPGTMLFWEPKHTEELKYGHVALIVEANAEYVVVAQQNRKPPIQMHKTRELFNAINSPKSMYLGVKLI
jgi:hypothetical protein